MKKIIKICASIALVVVVAFSFTACKKKISSTTVDTSKVKVVNNISTNGGITAVYGDYLYFINGEKTNDGKNLKDNTQSAVYRVKYNVETGEVDPESYERVIDNLVGYDKGSLYFFGDYMYYATPCTGKNANADTLYNRVSFMRYDLVYGKSYEIYTTKLNTSAEVVDYAYYISDNSLNLIVYEKNNATITSVKIDSDVTVNYTINEVANCLFSDNLGQSQGTTTDANNFVFYTLYHGKYEAVQTGVKVYRTSPTTNNSVCISDDGKNVSLLSVKNGKLIYSVSDDLGDNSIVMIFAQSITGANGEKLDFEYSNAISISYENYNNLVFIENEDGTVSILALNSSNEIILIDGRNLSEPTTIITTLSAPDDEKFEFIGYYTLTEEEVIVEDDEQTTEDETEIAVHEVKYLFFNDANIVYKVEIARKNDGEQEFTYSKFTEQIKLSTTSVNLSNGLLTAELVGDYLFAFAQDSNKKTYLFQIDASITENSTETATNIGVAE